MDKMTVQYVFKISKWNQFVSLTDVVQFHNGTFEDSQILIPYTHGYAFEEKLKQFADVEYQITSVRDVPITDDGVVIDGTHKDYDKGDWQ